jgi:hypothetical protein
LLSQRLGVTLGAALSMLPALGQRDVPLVELPERLAEATSQYLQAQTQLAALNPQNPLARPNRSRHGLKLMTHRFFLWFFQNPETGAITIAQAPNLSLWIVIVVGALIWLWHPPDRLGVALEIIFRGALFVWAVDEVIRGINPWRRGLGTAVLCYALWTLRS